MLATVLEGNPWEWEDQLKKACHAYNTSTHPGLKQSPFNLILGHKARLPVDVAFGLPGDQPVSTVRMLIGCISNWAASAIGEGIH